MSEFEANYPSGSKIQDLRRRPEITSMRPIVRQRSSSRENSVKTGTGIPSRRQSCTRFVMGGLFAHWLWLSCHLYYTFLGVRSAGRALSVVVDAVNLHDMGDVSRDHILLAYLSKRGSQRMSENLVYIESVARNCPLCSYVCVNFSSKNRSRMLVPDRHYVGSLNAFAGVRNFGFYDLLVKNFAAMEYFVTETKFGWMWRGTDDALVNFTRLRGFVEQISQTWDPVLAKIALGHCITGLRFARGPWFQGGSGWIVSRRLASALLPLFRDHLMEKALVGDDYMFARLIEKVGVSMFSATSAKFLGHDVWELRQGSEFPAGPSLPVCPSLDAGRGECRVFHSPISEVVFFHHRFVDKSSFRPIELAWRRLAAFASVDSNIHFYLNGEWAHLCYDDRQNSAGG